MNQAITLLTVAPSHYDLPGTETLAIAVGRLASDDRRTFRRVLVPGNEALKQLERYRAGYWATVTPAEWERVRAAGIVTV